MLHQKPCKHPSGISRHRSTCLLSVSVLALVITVPVAHADQIRVTRGQELVIDNSIAQAHTTSDIYGPTSAALWVSNGKFSVTNSEIDFLSEGRSASAIYIDDYLGHAVSDVKIIGAEGKTATIISTGASASAIRLSGDGSKLHLENVTIKSNGASSNGILMQGEGILNLINSSIEADSVAVNVNGKNSSARSSATIANSTITSHNGSAIYVINGKLNATDFIINSKGYGVNANQFSDVTLTSGRIETQNANANGIHASNNSSDTRQVKLRVNNVDIVTHGSNASGIENINVRSEINGGSIHTYGFGGHGVGAGNGGSNGWAPSHVTMTGTRITTEGESAYGLVATTKSTIDAKGLIINTSGLGAIGARSHGTGRIKLSEGTQITTSGDQAHGAAATFGSVLEVEDTSIKTSGNNSAGIYLVGYNTPENVTPITKHVNIANIKGSAIEVKNGAALLVSGGETNTLNLQNTHAKGVGDKALLFESREYIYQSGSTIIPMPVGTITLNAEGSLLEGDILINSGMVDFDLSNGSFLKGAARVGEAGLSLEHLRLDKTSGWEVTGSSVLNNLDSAGTISFASPENDSFKSLTVKDNFTSHDTLFVLNSKLGDDQSLTDRLIFEGAVIGTSRVSVNNAGGLGALTIGDGIMVVDAAQADSDAFTQEGRIAAGAYDYTLYAGDRSGNFDGHWYLRSVYNPLPEPEPDPDPKPEPDPDPKPEPEPDPDLPDYRAEVPLNMVAPVLANRFGLAMLGTYNDRRDRLSTNAPAFWFRAFGEDGSAGSSASKPETQLRNFYRDGASYDYKLGGFQAGVDLYLNETSDGSVDVAGLFAGIGRAEADVDRVYGGNAGKLTMNGYSFGGYWTHIDQSGWYSDVVVQGTRYDRVHSSSAQNVGMQTSGWGFISSLEGGYRHSFNDGWSIEPQAQLIYQHVSLDNTSDKYGHISFHDTNTVYGRVGAKLSYEWQGESGSQYSAWARMNVWHTMGGSAKTSFANLQGQNRVTLESDLGGTWGQIGLGLSAQLSEKVSLFASGDYNHSLGHNGIKSDSFSGRLGLKVQW